MTYNELRSTLKNYRDNHGITLTCKLNAKKEVLEEELDRVMDIISFGEEEDIHPVDYSELPDHAVDLFKASLYEAEPAAQRLDEFVSNELQGPSLFDLLSELLYLITIQLPYAWLKENTAPYIAKAEVKTRRYRATFKAQIKALDSTLDDIQRASDVLFPQENIDAAFYLAGKGLGWVWVNRWNIGDRVFGLV